jgi:hypothetical protein
MHSDSMGPFYCLLHVKMLLLSSVSRKDGELVELNAILEGQPRLCVKALVWLFTNTYPGVLGVHFLDNLDMCLRLTNYKATEQLISFRVSAPASLQLVFRSSLIPESFFFRLSFSALALPFLGASRSSSNCFLTYETVPNAFPMSWIVPFCSRRRLTAMTWTRYSLLVPLTEGKHLKISPAW